MTNKPKQPSATEEAPTSEQAEHVAETALTLFLQHGYDATPMSLVAKHAGLTKAGIYHHFESKEHLLYVVHKNHIERLLLPLIDQAEQETDPERRLRRFLVDYASLLARDPSARVLISESKRLDPEHYEDIRGAWRRGLNLIRGCIRQLQEAGRCDRQLNPTYAAFAAIGMCSWICNWFDYSRPEAGQSVARTMESLFLNGLLRGGN